MPVEIQVTVDQFSDVFVEPKRLQHQYIPLKKGSQPFKIRPYICLFIQKIDVEKKGQMNVEGWDNSAK